MTGLPPLPGDGEPVFELTPEQFAALARDMNGAGTLIHVTPDMEVGPWVDLADAPFEILTDYNLRRIGLMPNATAQGRPSVVLYAEPDDLTESPAVAVQLPWRAFWTAVTTLAASFHAQADNTS